VPLARLPLRFSGTSLVSILEHPDNWGVSILCWMAYKADGLEEKLEAGAFSRTP